jgi:dihydropteroate synthase
MDYTLNLNGQLFSLSQPVVMGILNVTPDSFFADSRQQTEQQIALRTRQMVEQGAAIIDIGACSTRPGSNPVSEAEEMERMRHALQVIRKELDDLSSLASPHSSSPTPSPFLSIDTFRPNVARMAVEEYGAHIINDVSEGSETMFRMTARLGTPYILTSVQPDLSHTLLTFAQKVQQLRDLGQKDIILDPGFGFGKTLEQNFQLFSEMEKMMVFDLPLLVGISRKSMIYKTLDCTPDDALTGTTFLHAIALHKGASILRVHDVSEAVQCCRLYNKLITA